MRIVCLVLFCLSVFSADTHRVILISIDGLRPEFYREASWPTPTLQDLAKRGIQAKRVKGVFPSVTYPAHTTIVTGALPAEHGIGYNGPFDPKGVTGDWFWYAKDIKVDTLWDAVKRKGLVSADLFWPVTVGAPFDYGIPEVWEPGKYSEFFSFIKTQDTPKGLLAKLEEQATGMLSTSTFNGDYLNREARTAYMASYLIETHQPHFMAIHLIATDHFQHQQGREGLMVRKALVAVDYAVNEIMEGCRRAGVLEETDFIILGDHGFANRHTLLAPNRWLVDAGLLENKLDRGNWKAAFHSAGASAFLFLKDPSDTETLNKVIGLLEKLPSSTRKLFEILSREDLDQIQAGPGAALALNPIPGVDFTARVMDIDINPTSGATHGYKVSFPEIYSGLIGYGPSFKEGVTVNEMGLVDVAPMIAHIMDLDFKSPEGALFPGLFRQ